MSDAPVGAQYRYVDSDGVEQCVTIKPSILSTKVIRELRLLRKRQAEDRLAALKRIKQLSTSTRNQLEKDYAREICELASNGDMINVANLILDEAGLLIVLQHASEELNSAEAAEEMLSECPDVVDLIATVAEVLADVQEKVKNLESLLQRGEEDLTGAGL